jgi:MFS family permease
MFALLGCDCSTKGHVSEAVTLTLLLRSVGAAIFGIFADYFGRKYPLVINMWLLGALQIGTIYTQTFQQFLAVRALFGLAMGGVYGAAASMALESLPADARGLMSGIFQQGECMKVSGGRAVIWYSSPSCPAGRLLPRIRRCCMYQPRSRRGRCQLEDHGE